MWCKVLLSCSSDTFANIDVITYVVFSKNSIDVVSCIGPLIQCLWIVIDYLLSSANIRWVGPISTTPWMDPTRSPPPPDLFPHPHLLYLMAKEGYINIPFKILYWASFMKMKKNVCKNVLLLHYGRGKDGGIVLKINSYVIIILLIMKSKI